MTGGHVFLVRGDLRLLQCDAIGYSGNPDSELSSLWRETLGSEAETWAPAESWPIDGWRWVRRLSGTEGEPVPYVVPVAGTSDHEPAWFLAALRVFLDQAAADVRKQLAARETPRPPKLAIPFFGAGKGGLSEKQGDLLLATLRMLWDYTAQHDVDVVMVFRTSEAFDAAQWFRGREQQRPWASLSAAHLEEADRLARLALAGDMALFLGAGVSMAAGLPSWRALLEEAARGKLSEAEIQEASGLSVLDQGQLLSRVLGERDLQQVVATAIGRHRRPSLAHVLLAALPVQEIVTTNYDTLFEQAAREVGRGVHVLPYQGVTSGQVRWLMKLHGSIDNASDIVLSRQTFVQYEASRAALAGLLAGLLMTRHMVFVGSSFSDDNVLRIIDEVQRLRGPTTPAGGSPLPRLGTNLAIGSPSVQRRLWEGDMHWVSLGDGAQGGRQLEIVLDRVLASTTTSASYLFASSFESALSEQERQLHDQLGQLFALAEGIEHPAVRTLIEQLDKGLGRPKKSVS